MYRIANFSVGSADLKNPRRWACTDRLEIFGEGPIFYYRSAEDRISNLNEQLQQANPGPILFPFHNFVRREYPARKLPGLVPQHEMPSLDQSAYVMSKNNASSLRTAAHIFSGARRRSARVPSASNA